MAWTITQRASYTTSGTSATSRTTASFTPAANSRLFCFVVCEMDNNGSAYQFSYSDSLGGSWTADSITSEYTADNFGASFDVCAGLGYVDIGGSPASMTVTVDHTAGTGNAYYAIVVFDVTGYDTGTPFAQARVVNGLGSIALSDSQSGTLTLGSAPTSGNLVIACFGAGNEVAGACSAPTGYSTLTSQSQAFVHAGIFYHEATTTAAVTSSDLGEDIVAWAGVIFELKAAAGGGASPTSNVLTSKTLRSLTQGRVF